MSDAARDRMDEAWNALDKAFGPRRDHVAPLEACDHCFGVDERAILGGPVDEIPRSLFARAVFDWGSTADESVLHWRRYTPRLLRGMIQGTQHIPENMIAGKFVRAGWLEWPPPERQAVTEVCQAWWSVILATDDGFGAAFALEFLVPLTTELSPWLRIWSETTGPTADGRILELWHWWRIELCSDDLDVSFSGTVPNIAPELTAWLLEEIPRRGLLSEFDDEDAYVFTQLALPLEQRFH